MYVPAGLIEEGGNSLRVAHDIYIDFNAPWDIIGDSGLQHKGLVQQTHIVQIVVRYTHTI
jgi:TPP-dependent indolepyruvate ferredoxin oxidoreductase alpha subunit